MKTYQCKYCGHRENSIESLVLRYCPFHPNGNMKGRHVVYRGGNRSKYECEHCGHKEYSLENLVVRPCPYHPKGSMKGRHSAIEDFSTEELDREIGPTKRSTSYSTDNDSVHSSKKKNINSESSKGGCVSLILLILGILGGAIAVFNTVFTSENPENKVIDRDTITQKLKEELDTIDLLRKSD